MDEGKQTSLEERMAKEGLSYVGFGLVYEKFILSQLVKKLVSEYEIKTVCEYPANSLMGNNSDVFEGCEVTRTRKPSDLTKKFDLVWNFCEFEQANDPTSFMDTTLDLSRSYVMIVTQNLRNIGVLTHRLYHLLWRVPWDHGYLPRMSANAVKSKLGNADAKIIETGAFDVPWFVLDLYESGKFLRKLIFDAGTSERDLKESMFERSPMWLRSWLSHHRYVLIRKSQSSTSDSKINSINKIRNRTNSPLNAYIWNSGSSPRSSKDYSPNR